MKDDIRKKSINNPGKYYPVKSLQKLGFNRSICKHCGKALWSIEERDFCDEPECRLKSGFLPYGFIDDPPTEKRYNYTAWLLCFVFWPGL